MALANSPQSLARIDESFRVALVIKMQKLLCISRSIQIKLRSKNKILYSLSYRLPFLRNFTNEYSEENSVLRTDDELKLAMNRSDYFKDKT